MSHSTAIKRKAFLLRKRGYSIKEIEGRLNISRSTASLWLREVVLPSKALDRLKERRLYGQYKARATILEKSEKQHLRLVKEINKMLLEIKMTKPLMKVFCSLIYYCEGNKQTGHVRFTNSDPSLIRLFMFLFRGGFNLDESKLRGLVHLHEYHHDKRQKNLRCFQIFPRKLQPDSRCTGSNRARTV